MSNRQTVKQIPSTDKARVWRIAVATKQILFVHPRVLSSAWWSGDLSNRTVHGVEHDSEGARDTSFNDDRFVNNYTEMHGLRAP